MQVTILFLMLTTLCAFSWDSSAEKQTVEGQPKQKYLTHDSGDRQFEKKKLLLVLPGGDGSESFAPFVGNMEKHALPEEYLVAQLIAVKWTPAQKIVWPTEHSKVKAMQFTTEDFIRGVIKEVKKGHLIDDEHIYTLSWSSSGPAAYAASLTVEGIKGSFVAMSVFKPKTLPSLAKANGQRYFIYHSPQDKVCPFRMAQQARKSLQEKGATVEFVTYEGGHGWHGNVFGEIRQGIQWLEKRK